MKNYYELLEVDIHASSEMIERAYKLLAKRYHPDTQPKEKKTWAEEEFKKINEAYEILSDKEKREHYTNELTFEKESEINALILEKENLEEQLIDLKLQLQLYKNNQASKSSSDFSHIESNQTNSSAYGTNPAYNQSYHFYTNYVQEPQPTYYEAYYHPIKSKLKSLLAFVLTILGFIGIVFLIWQIPFIRNRLIDFYENNNIIKSIIDFFLRFFQ